MSCYTLDKRVYTHDKRVYTHDKCVYTHDKRVLNIAPQAARANTHLHTLKNDGRNMKTGGTETTFGFGVLNLEE